MNIWTVGHSTRTLDVFKEILVANGIEVLIGIKYEHEPRLGGRRTPRKDSHNTAWRNPQFRGYADHMETEEFEQGIKALLELADRSRTTVMCAEAVWWRCHRSLIADYLKAQGHTVVHIMDVNKTEEHPFTAAASIVEGKLSYRGLF
jgi:uncharacterized protein (DUF488 family)